MSDDPYAAALDQMSGAPVDPFDRALGELDSQGKQQRLAADLETQDYSPDQYGEARRISQQTGIPVGIVVENLDPLKKEQEKTRTQAAADASPTLSRWLTKPENMGVGRDDLEGLSLLDRTLSTVKGATFGSLRTMLGGMMRGTGEVGNEVVPAAGQLFTALTQGLRMGGPAGAFTAQAMLNQEPAKIGALTTLADEGDQLARLGTEQLEAGRPTNAVGGYAYDVASALPPIATAIASNIVLPGSGLPLFGALASGSYYQEGRADMGLGVRDAAQRAAVLGTAEFITEAPAAALLKTPLKALADYSTLAPAVVKLLGLGVVEGKQEGLTQGLQEAYDAGVVGQETTLEDALTRIGYASIVGVGAGTAVGIPSVLSDRSQREVADRIANVAESETDAQRIDALTKAGAALKTSDRSPDAVEEFVREAGQTGSLYVDAVQAREFFQSQGLDPLATMREITGDPAQVAEALATGGDLIIPVERYVARVSKTPYAEGVQRLARFDATRLSQADLESPELQKQIQGIVDAQPAEQAQPDPVFDTVRAQLLAAGRSKAEADAGAKTMATAFERRAERRGKSETAADLFKLSGLQITGDSGAPEPDSRTFQQSAIQGELPQTGLAPANVGADGTLYVGRKGGLHFQIAEQFQPEGGFSGFGFVTPEGQYLNREDALAWVNANEGEVTPSENMGSELDAIDYRQQVRQFAQADGSGPRARIELRDGSARIVLTDKSDRSSFFHESGHLFLEQMIEDAQVSEEVAADLDTALAWFSDNSKGLLSQALELNPYVPVEVKGKFVVNRPTQQPETFDTIEEAQARADVLVADLRAELKSGGEQAIKDRVRSMGRAAITDADAARDTVAHEQFARGFEAYLMTGKAPTSELKKLFAAFKRWFAQLYRDIRQLNVTLSPEITNVMDRLLASEDAILEAAAAQNYAMSLPVAEMRKLGISEEKLVAYSRSIEAAQDELGDKLMEDYQRRELGQEYRDTLKANAAAVDAETRKDKLWNDLEMLSKGKRLDEQPVPEGMAGVKIATADAPAEILPTLKARGVVKANGSAADYVATLLDYPSGQVLMQAVAGSPTRKQYIAAEAKRRTDLEFPDAMTDGTLENRALEALHNARMHAALQTELNLLGELARQPVPPARAIREAAARIVASKTPAQNRPFQYLTQERKAARKAAIAAAAGKYAEALVHKREQALNAALYSEALQAQKDVEKLDKLMRRLDKKSTRETVALGGPDFLTQLDQIRHVYSYTEVSPAALDAWASMRSFLDNLQAEGEITSVSDRVLSNVDRQRVQDSAQVKVGELREVYEASRNLMHLASQANKVRKGEELVSREQAITEMLAAAEASGVKLKAIPRSQRELSRTDKGANYIANMGMNILRPENIFEAMDGGETGPWHDYWFNALDRSEKAMNDLRRRIGRSLKKLREAMPTDFLKSLDKSVTVLPGVTMKRSTLLAAVLNSGNAGNLQRLASGGLLDGAGKPVMLTPQQIAIGRALLTDAELAYVQGLWDTVDSLWPDITELQRRVSGVPVEKVTAATFTVRGKQYRGGYWPLVYDSQRSNVGEVQTDADALRILMGQGFTRAATPKGYQKARAEEFSAPLLLDYGAVVSRHLDHVMTDLSYRETVKHVSALMRSGRIKQALLERVGQAGYDNLKGQLAYSVSASSQVAGQSAKEWRRFFDTVLSNMSVSALAIRPDIALGNFTSALIQGMDRTGLKGLMRGLWQSYASRSDTSEIIRAKSKFMSARLDEVDHWYAQELQWTDGKSGLGPAFRRAMMALHRMAAFEVERAIWTGRYLNERQAGTEEDEAVALADKTIRQTQTANERKDLSTFERDTSFRQTRQFMGPMFVIFGRMNEIAKGQGNSRQVGERFVRLFLQVFLAPAIFALAAGRWPEDGDDDEEIGTGEWAIWTAANTLLFPLQTLPLFRDFGSSIEAAMTGNPLNPRAAPTSTAVTNMVKAGVGISKKIEEYQDTDELDYWGMTRDLVSMGGPILGLPSSQYRITTKGIEAALDDDEDDRNLAALLLYGPPR